MIFSTVSSGWHAYITIYFHWIELNFYLTCAWRFGKTEKFGQGFFWHPSTQYLKHQFAPECHISNLMNRASDNACSVTQWMLQWAIVHNCLSNVLSRKAVSKMLSFTAQVNQSDTNDKLTNTFDILILVQGGKNSVKVSPHARAKKLKQSVMRSI